MSESAKVHVEKIGEVERRIEVDVPASVVERTVDTIYRDLQKRARLKGFRPGKVPREILQRYYSREIEEEIVSRIVTDTLRKAYEEHSIKAVSDPAIEAGKVDPKAPYRFTARVEVRPEVSLRKTEGFKIKKAVYEVIERDVDEKLEQIRDAAAQWVEEGEGVPAARGHRVTIDYSGLLQGEPLEGGSAEGAVLELGSDRSIPSFEEGIEGMRRGEERSFPVSFPDEYREKRLAGKEVLFWVKLSEIKRREVPGLDDDFARDQGEYEGLAEFRSKVKDDVAEAFDREGVARAKSELLDKLIEANPFEIPPSMLRHQISHLQARMREFARAGGAAGEIDLEKEEVKKDMRARAERDIRSTLILDAVAEGEGIKVAEEEVDERLAHLARAVGQTLPAFKKLYREKGRLEGLRGEIREEKTLDFLYGKATIKEAREKRKS